MSGEIFPRQPVMTILDSFRNVIDTDNGSLVEAFIADNPRNATLLGEGINLRCGVAYPQTAP